MKQLLFAAMLILTSLSNAQVSFQQVPGTANGLDAAIDAWKAEVVEAQGGVNPPSGWWLWGVTLCDIDNDGDQDVLAAHHSNLGGAILLNQFSQTGQVAFVDGTTQFIAGHGLLPLGDAKYRCWDFDHDGRKDLGGFSDETNVSSYFNDPGGFVQMPGSFGPIASPKSTTLNWDEMNGIADITGDGYEDVIYWAVHPIKPEYVYDPVNRRFISRPRTYIQPIFPSETQAKINAEIAAGSVSTHIVALEYDMDNDGLQDVLVTGFRYYSGSQWLRLLIRQADNSLLDMTTARGLPLDSAVSLVEDLTGDGRLDLILWRGAGSGYWKAQQNFTYVRSIGECGTGSQSIEGFLNQNNQSSATQIRALDFDFDGDKDLLMHNHNSIGYLKVCQNNGPGNSTMTNVAGFSTTAAGWRGEMMDVADMNNDGKLDIVAGYPRATDSIAIWLNTSTGIPPPPPPPVIITTNALPQATMGAGYLFQVLAEGGLGPYLWDVVSGSLPPGMLLQTQGQLSGTPTCLSTYNVTLRATDSAGTSATKPLVLILSCVP